MGKAAKQSDIVSFKELLLANSIQIDALTQLLIETGLITEGVEENARELRIQLPPQIA
jgi:hypothetical protein